MKILPFAVSLFLLIGCSTEESKTVESTNTEEAVEKTVDPVYPDFYFDTLVGSYEGDFAGSPIRININFASNKHATGYNIHKGLVRNISGPITEDSNSIFLTLAEPGENEFDGVFNLIVNREDLKMSGNWTPNDENLTTKKFVLERIPDRESAKKTKHIRISEFMDYLGYVGDTIGDLYFDYDGLVKYEYYPVKDDVSHKEQMETVRGNWTISNDSTILINWENNTVFENRKSNVILREEKRENYTDMYLYFEGRILYPEMY